jgi:hypothetical protein
VSSLALPLLATVLTVPFGAPVPVRLADPSPPLRAGARVGDFLVATDPQPGPGSSSTVVLRPLAIGTLTVPLPGAPDPDVVVVQPTLGPQAAIAGVVVPPPPALPWLAAVTTALVAAAAVLAAAAIRRWRRPNPVAALEKALRPLALPAGWGRTYAADRLARTCREFLQHVTGAPCAAMTTRELSRLLAARLDAATARPFGLALVLADEVRFAGCALAPEDAALVVRDLLAAVPALAAAGRATR